jgi:hypothetical protein
MVAHLLDGSLGHDVEQETTFQSGPKEVEDEEDFFSEPHSNKKNIRHSLVLLDSKRFLTSWDMNCAEPKQTLKLEKAMTDLIFIPKYCLYAGLVEQNIVKVW